MTAPAIAAPGPMIPISPAPRAPVGVTGDGVSNSSMHQRWNVVSGRQHVVEQRRGGWDTLGGERDLLHQRATDPLHDAALNLATDDGRIYEPPAIADRRVADETDGLPWTDRHPRPRRVRRRRTCPRWDRRSQTPRAPFRPRRAATPRAESPTRRWTAGTARPSGAKAWPSRSSTSSGAAASSSPAIRRS